MCIGNYFKFAHLQNIRKFKEIVNTWENSEENFRLFCIWIENYYVLSKKKYDLEMMKTKKFTYGCL